MCPVTDPSDAQGSGIAGWKNERQVRDTAVTAGRPVTYRCSSSLISTSFTNSAR
jgi:hypothetical protein